MKIVLVRQRPSMGDCLLLAPLIRCIHNKHRKAQITVVTDTNWGGGVARTIFQNMPHVNRVEAVPMTEWTTQGNREVDPLLGSVHGDTPYSVSRADVLYDCNGAFIAFERNFGGNPPFGIAEFWVKHFGFETTNYKPAFKIADIGIGQQWKVTNKIDKPMIGFVLRSGSFVRDYPLDRIVTLVEWARTTGYEPVTIDHTNRLSREEIKGVFGLPIDDVASIMKQMELVVTPDTGILHLAEAIGVPTVAIWGIMNPELRVKDYACSVVPNQSLGFCDADEAHCQCPWKFQQWSCLKRLPPGQIIDTIQRVLHGKRELQAERPESVGA